MLAYAFDATGDTEYASSTSLLLRLLPRLVPLSFPIPIPLPLPALPKLLPNDPLECIRLREYCWYCAYMDVDDTARRIAFAGADDTRVCISGSGSKSELNEAEKPTVERCLKFIS